VAIGNPLGLASSVSQGITSSLNRDIGEPMFDDHIKTDAGFNHGNSGGPPFDRRGEVIGVNMALFTPDAYNRGSIGLGLAIPSTTAAWVVDLARRPGADRHKMTLQTDWPEEPRRRTRCTLAERKVESCRWTEFLDATTKSDILFATTFSPPNGQQELNSTL